MATWSRTRPRLHSSAEALIVDLPAHSIVTVATAQKFLGRSKQAVNEAIAALADRGVLHPIIAPFLEHALATFAGAWLFPDDAGEIRTKHWQPEDVLRRALKRAGIVTGYTHKCRRKGRGHEETHADAGQRRCRGPRPRVP